MANQVFFLTFLVINWKKILKKVFTLPLLLGMIIGLIISSLKIPLPDIIFDFMCFLSLGNTPIGLLLLGVYLSFDLNKCNNSAFQKYCLFNIFSTFQHYSLFVFTKKYNDLLKSTMKSVLMLISILPPCIMSLPFSDEINYDTRIAVPCQTPHYQ